MSRFKFAGTVFLFLLVFPFAVVYAGDDSAGSASVGVGGESDATGGTASVGLIQFIQENPGAAFLILGFGAGFILFGSLLLRAKNSGERQTIKYEYI